MTELDIISVENAKDWLSTEDEMHLPRLIASAVDWVEKYTGYRLYQRPMTVYISEPSTMLTGYPVEVISVVDSIGDPVSYDTTHTARGLHVEYGYGAYAINVNVGYALVSDVPPILIEAAYKVLTYMYENRDMYPINMPTDIQFMINKMRRNLV